MSQKWVRTSPFQTKSVDGQTEVGWSMISMKNSNVVYCTYTIESQLFEIRIHDRIYRSDQDRAAIVGKGFPIPTASSTPEQHPYFHPVFGR